MFQFCHFLVTCYFCMALFACQSGEKSEATIKNETETMKASITETPFGALPDGTPVSLYTLTNKNGLEIKITNYGGIIVSINTPDKAGKMADIVLGFDSLPPYLETHPYFGAIIGRYGNRIANGRFTLDGTTYTLAANNGPNHLHGGVKGFDKHVWQAETKEAENEVTLKLFRVSPDGEEGYPGTLQTGVDYTLTNNDELKIYYAARSDKKTIVNLTNHAYFNLTGNAANDIHGHELSIQADSFLPVNDALIPTGKPRELNGGPFDFSTAKPIGKDIAAEDDQLKIVGGYDHCWVLRKDRDNHKPQLAASVFEPNSGRAMEVYTTEPGMQFYTGNFLDGSLTGKGGTAYKFRSAFCLETEHYPDSPNQPQFPSVVLKPGSTYRTTTVYRFYVK